MTAELTECIGLRLLLGRGSGLGGGWLVGVGWGWGEVKGECVVMGGV